MARPIRNAVLVCAGIAGLVAGGVAVLVQRLRRYDLTGADLMAKFEGLDADIDELKAAVADAAQRVEDAVAKLMDDTADQAEIEQARGEVREAIDALKAIAPAPAPPPAPEEPVA